MLIRRLLPFLCAMGLLLSGSAFADTTITGPTKTPLKTSTSGDITINQNGAVNVDLAGAAVTVDSNNKLNNNGKITNKAKTGAIGVLLQGGGDASDFNLGNAITLDGKDATGGIGIEVAPTGYTGDISLGVPSNVSVTGANSTGLAIFGPLVGDVTMAGQIIVTGEHSVGVLTTATVTGEIINDGLIKAQGTATPSAKTANPQSGSALAIGGSVTAGVYNAGPDTADTTFPIATIESFGSAPTVFFSPSLAGVNASDIVIGIFADPDNLNEGYSFLNRGLISANGLDPGVNATAVLIEGDAQGHTVTLEGGIFNNHIISAIAHTGDKHDNTAAADAVALEIGDGGIVEKLGNAGQIAAQTIGLGGGSATTVLIDAGGSLESLNNSGSLTANAALSDVDGFTGTLAACVVCDFSGTLTSLINSGTMNAIATALDDDSQITIAADLSHVAAGTDVTFLNTGDVSGDVLFGASDDTLSIKEGGTLVGDVSFGSGTNNLTIVGTTGDDAVLSTFSGAISYDATGGGTLDLDVGVNGSLRTPDADATSLNVASGGNVIFVLGAEGPAPGSNEGIITTTGHVVFAGGSAIGFGFDSSLPDSGNYALIYAAGGLTFPGGNTDPTQNVGVLSFPWLYARTLAIPNPNELTIDFERKTASCTGTMTPLSAGSTCLGLTGNQAAIYGAGGVGTESYIHSPLIEAARTDKLFGAELMSLATPGEVDAALNSLMPDISGDTRAIAIALTDQSTGAIGARQRTLTEYANANADLNLWGVEYAHYLTDNGESDAAPGFAGRGFGFTLGLDGGSPRNGRFGGGLTFFGGNVTENAPRDSKTQIEWYMASLYSNWRGRVLFFNTQANAGYGNFDGNRVIEVGSLKRRATGAWSDYLVSGGFSTGMIFTSGSLVMSPLLNVDALYVRENSYDEGGAGGENLSIGDRNQKSLRAFLGFQLRENFDLDDGYLQPELRGGWSYDFLNGPEDVTASFSNVTNPLPFKLTGPEPDASRLVGGTSLTWAYRSWSLGFNYDIMAGSGSYSHSGTITLTGRI